MLVKNTLDGTGSGSTTPTWASGEVREGTLDAKGHAKISDPPRGEYTVEMGEDERDYKPPPLEPDPLVQQANEARRDAGARLEAERAAMLPTGGIDLGGAT